MSKEYFNVDSKDNLAIAIRLLPLTILLAISMFLILNTKNLQVKGPWGLRSLGIGIAFISISEMIAYEQRLRNDDTPLPSPAPSKNKNNRISVIIGIIAICIGLGFTFVKYM
jgi:hypothetical protein